MAEHPTPNGDDIILPDGTVVGSWNGDDVKDLQVEVQRIIACLLYTSPSPRDS